MTRRIRAAAFATLALGVLLVACEHDEWAYRPRLSDGGDAMVPVDGSDAPQGSDAVAVDVPDGATMPDATIDGASPDGTTPDAPSSGITLRAQGFTTAASGVPTAGALRLIEGGFESAPRVCTGTVCLVGGMLP